MLVIGLPAAVGMVLFAGPLVATVYGHGRFSVDDVRMTTYALWAYGIGFIGFSLIKVLTPGFYARQETRLPIDRKSTRLNSSHYCASRMPSSACKKKTTT